MPSTDGTILSRDICSGVITERHVQTGGLDATILIEDGTLDITPFASGITPVQLVSSLPTCDANANGEVAYLTTDNQLYRCDGSSWVVMTPDGANIVANTITAGQIAAGAIGVSELAADAVTADAIAASAIYVEHLIAGSFDNLATNPIFEADVIDGDDDPHLYNTGSGGTWSESTGNPRSGTRAARFDVDSQGSTAFLHVNGQWSTPAFHFAASEGDEVYAEFWVRSAGTGTIPDVDVELRFVDEAGSSVSTTNGSNVTPTSTYAQVSHSQTAPAGTAYVAMLCRILTGGAADAAVLIDSLYMRRMVDNAIVVSDLDAAKITVGTLTGITIEGNTIQTVADGSDRIALESGDADKIKFYDQANVVQFQIWFDDAGNKLFMGDLGAARELEISMGAGVTIGTDDTSGTIDIVSASTGSYGTRVQSGDDVEVLRIESNAPTYTDEMVRLLADDNAGYDFLRTRSDADGTPDDQHRLESDGDINIDGSYLSTGGDYAEMFEALAGVPIPPGRAVTLEGELVRLAEPGEWLLGVVSAVPAIVGNSPLNWPGKRQRDEWGRLLYESEQWVYWHVREKTWPDPRRPEAWRWRSRRVDYSLAQLEEEGITPPHDATWTTRQRLILTDDFDPDRGEYVRRHKRPEWVPVALVGRLRVEHDGTLEVDGFATTGPDGILTAGGVGYGHWRVMQVFSSDRAEVLIR